MAIRKGNDNIAGTLSQSGLSENLLITTLVVGDTATLLPASSLTNRKSVNIHNTSATITLYVGNSDVTADTVVGITSGWEVPPKSRKFIDLAKAIDIYGRCPSGESATIKVEEVA